MKGGGGGGVNLQLLVALENLTTFPAPAIRPFRELASARSTRYDAVKAGAKFKKRQG